MTERLKWLASLEVRKGPPGERQVLNLENVIGGMARTTGDLQIAPAGSLLAFEPGDVLFSKLRPYLAKSLLVREPMFGTGEFLAIRPGDRLDARFLLYVTLSAPWLEWANMGSYGAKMPRTSWEVMSDFRLDWPDLDAQRRIADFLDEQVGLLNRALHLHREEVLLLEERFNAHVEWTLWEPDETERLMRLGYAVERVTSGPRGWGDYVGPVGRPFFRSANLRRDSLVPNLSNLALVAVPGGADAEAVRASVRRGDLLIGITGANAGWVTHVRDDALHGAVVSQHVALVRPLSTRLDSAWLGHLLRSHGCAAQLAAMQYGGTKTQLSLPNVRDLRIPSRPLEQQVMEAKTLDEEAEALWRYRSLADERLSLLQERKRALITAAVTGALDVTTARSAAR